MRGGNSMRKPTRCQLCQVVQCSKCHRGFLFCFTGPELRNGAGSSLLTGSPPPPSAHFISSKAKDSWVSPQHPRVSHLVPMVHVRKRGLRPKGTCPAVGVTAERSRHPAIPPWLPPLSKKNTLAFSSFQAAAFRDSAYFQWVSSGSGICSR